MLIKINYPIDLLGKMYYNKIIAIAKKSKRRIHE